MSELPRYRSPSKKEYRLYWQADLFSIETVYGKCRPQPEHCLHQRFPYTADDFDATRFDRALREFECLRINVHWSYDVLAANLNPNLYDALRDLENAGNEAREEKFPVPSDISIGNARRLLHAMYSILPRRFEVYPTPDREIAIDVRGGLGYGVLLLCESDGGVLCLVSMNGAHRRARYSDAHTLPNGFVREALLELEAREHAHE